MELRKLSDEELAKGLTELVAKERSLLYVIIMHVMEISRRQSFLKTHANVFSYLTELLKYSHGSAQRRRDAAMLALEVPQLLTDVESGTLNLSQITATQVGFRLAEKTFKARVTTELKQEVLSSIRDKSVKESEVIIYSLLNIKPKTRSKIKRQADGSVRIEMTLSKSQWAKLEHAKELVSHSVPNGQLDEFIEYLCERVIVYKDKTKPRPERTRPKPGLAKQAGMKTSSKGKEPAGECVTENFNQGDSGTVTRNHGDDVTRTCFTESNSILKSQTKCSEEILAGTKCSVAGKNSQKIPVGTESLATKKGPAVTSASSLGYTKIPARTAIRISMQRKIFARDRCCQYKDSMTDKICASRWQLQLDHIQPVWAGGADSEENLRLLCGTHNRRVYAKQSGQHSVPHGRLKF